MGSSAGSGLPQLRRAPGGEINIQGYVRNRPDGSVEVLGMGTLEDLEKLRKGLERGPMMSRVSGVSEESSAVEPRYLGDFTIEFTE